ncbi:MAG: DUF1559 domain-containing protein [Verrucomicrobiae bacterium]|nr:DUF1559 domain-containing protein [Verrucomicrobiae bacterium]
MAKNGRHWFLLAGFTMVELLVTVVILSMLAALLSPALRNARESAKAIQCVNNLRQIDLALISYTNDNLGFLPCYGNIATSVDDRKWYNLIKRYLNCPSSRTVIYSYLRCPSEPDLAIGTYGANYGPATLNINFIAYEGQPPWWIGSKNIADVPPRVMLIADGGIGVIFHPLNWSFLCDYDGDGILDSCNAATTIYNGLRPRHRGGANIGFADGSVRWVPILDWVRGTNMWGP